MLILQSITSTAIRQYSTGRSHVLGLADDGKVWSWVRNEARQIKLMHVDLTPSNVIRVVAGIGHCYLVNHPID